MALAEIVLSGKVLGQQWVRRLNYEILFATIPFDFSQSLLSTFTDDAENTGTLGEGGFPYKMLQMMSNSVSLEEVTVRDVYSVTDFFSGAYANTGAIASTPVATFAAFGFVTTRVRTDIRRGTMRLPGVVSTQVEAGGNFTIEAKALMNSLAVEAGAQLGLTSGLLTAAARPVIVGKQKYFPGCDPFNLPCEPGQRPAYRYYPTIEEQELHLARGIAWTIEPAMTTQNSRKAGRGA